jgi:hypothetical protein
VSYLPHHPAQLGILIPEEQARAFRPAVERAFIFDQLTSQVLTLPGAVARHPTERAEDAPTDAILGEPATAQITAELVDKPLNTGLYPFPIPGVRPDRALNRAADLMRLKDTKSLFTYIGPGVVLANRAIAALVVTPSPDDGRVSIQLTLERVVLVDLQTVAVVPDSDSVALGAQKVEHGFRR